MSYSANTVPTRRASAAEDDDDRADASVELGRLPVADLDAGGALCTTPFSMSLTRRSNSIRSSLPAREMVARA